MERANAEKTSAVHFLRFELTAPMVAGLKAGADIALGVDHSAYTAAVEHLPAAIKSSLLEDLRS